MKTEIVMDNIHRLLLIGILCVVLASCSANHEKNETMTKEQLMREAIRLSEENVINDGGPLGAVIARDGKIVATGVNRVTANNDPTAHAEVSAIRAACEKLNTFDLSGCKIYTSCEPCPMCLGAILWSFVIGEIIRKKANSLKLLAFCDCM